MLHFLEPVLAHHDTDRVKIICYVQNREIDTNTQRLMGYGHTWVSAHALDDKALAARIESDKIDILVDCAGHAQGTRLCALTCKPAPIMMSWMGYPGKPQLPGTDYRLTDEWLDPPGRTGNWQTEELLYIPGGMLAYRPHEQFPNISAVPSAQTGRITFGSLDSVRKINPALVSLWSKILQNLPDARLLLQSGQLADARTTERICGMFEAFGISPDRLEMREATPDFLNVYSEIDIVLDTLPYGGCATTCDALWMGVPVITIAGERPAGRLSTSILNQIGHPEWAVASAEAYVRQACDLAKSPELLSHIRSNLRAEMQSSALCDEAGYVCRLEQVYSEAIERHSQTVTG